MSDIPKARGLLEEVLDSSYLEGPEAEKIAEALSLMTRKSASRVAPSKNRGVTPEQWDKVVRLSSVTSKSQHEIAAAVGLNPGRVSEILNGKRKRPAC
jgi:plasmid maintenance system antidote protein VapI